MKKSILRGNIIKNIIIIIILILSFNAIQRILSSVNETDFNIVLTVANVLLVGALFGNFSFTYEHINTKNRVDRYLAHITTALLMLSIGLLFEISIIILNLKLGALAIIFTPVAILIYIAVILYDFWDIKRAETK